MAESEVAQTTSLCAKSKRPACRMPKSKARTVRASTQSVGSELRLLRVYQGLGFGVRANSVPSVQQRRRLSKQLRPGHNSRGPSVAYQQGRAGLVRAHTQPGGAELGLIGV